MIVVDTNVIIYHLAGNHPVFSSRSSKLIERIMVGEETAFISAIAFAETLFALRATYGIPVEESATHLLPICQSENVASEMKPALIWALQMTVNQRKLSFPDCYQLALAHELGINRIATFDKKMDRYPGVERIEPE